MQSFPKKLSTIFLTVRIILFINILYILLDNLLRREGGKVFHFGKE